MGWSYFIMGVKMESINNIEVNKKENYCLISVNPKIYPLDVVYSASYVFLDKAYILLDGDPEDRIIVELRPKEDYDIEKLGREFNNELLSYADYKKRSESSKIIRESIIKRALLTNDSFLAGKEEDYLEDPEGIAVPWEEKDKKKGGKK